MERTLTKRQRWLPSEWKEIEAGAKAMGVKPSDFLRWSGLRIAKEQVKLASEKQ